MAHGVQLYEWLSLDIFHDLLGVDFKNTQHVESILNFKYLNYELNNTL